MTPTGPALGPADPAAGQRPASDPIPGPIDRIAGPVVMGAVPGQPQAVALRAAELALSLGVPLICAYVDVTSYLADDPGGRRPSDPSGARPIDPDGIDDDVEGIAAALKARLGETLEAGGVPWSFVALAGDPARALGRLAEASGASIIVVGTRERGLGARFEELLVGSVAVHLTHRQHRPVLVVPLAPQLRHHSREDR